MRVANTNLRSVVLLGTMILASTLAVCPACDEADPNSVPSIFASAGGPYSGTVGNPIEFDASLSCLSDGNDIEGYYWDWDMSENFECVSLPVCTHTWQCAYSGPVRVYIWNDANNVDWAQAYVNVTGPETMLCVVLKSDADLHLYDPSLRHVGMDYATNGPEMEVPESTFRITDGAGKVVPLYGHGLGEEARQQIMLPLYCGGPYRVHLVGAEDGPFELDVYGYQDGVCVAQESYKGDIYGGETIRMTASASCKDGALGVACSSLSYGPKLKVEPDKIDLAVDPARPYEVVLTLTETSGYRPLRSVTLECSKLGGAVHPIAASAVTFDLNGFDIPPGGVQDVLVTIPVPQDFLGKVSGSITINCLDDVSKTIGVVVHKKGFHPPSCNPGGPYEGKVGEPITFDAGWSDDKDGTITQFCWDWDWDGLFECTSDSIIQHTWYEPFTGTVLLRVIDNDGHSAEKSVSVVVKEP